MNLQSLLSVIPNLPETVFSNRDVTGVFNDARKVVPDSVFVAIRGTQVDGHQFIPDAIAKGAFVLVVEDKDKVPSDFKGLVVRVPSCREILESLASRFYLDPGQELFCVGVTGTNGKTSVTYMVEAILNRGQLPTGVIGTVNHRLGHKVWGSEMTTPDPLLLQQRLREFRDEGAQAVAIEVSSHALAQHRVDSVPFNAVIFTNLTRDHLDYHETMEHYFESKQRLFTDLLWKTQKEPSYAIVNTGDKWGRRLRVADDAILWTYGAKDSDIRHKILKMNFTSTEFEVLTSNEEATVHLPMSGEHNVLNAVAAIGAGLAAGLPLAVCADALKDFQGVPGRLQSVPNNQELAIFVDYAHSPDALENVLHALRDVRESLKSSAKIWTIFGCGGDRDKGKRPLMAKIAEELSDRVVVTSDNPRTEEPQKIVDDIVAGLSNRQAAQVILDRREAINLTVKQAQPGDVILIAGKGHEDYQIIGKEKTSFSDVLVAEQALKGRV